MKRYTFPQRLRPIRAEIAIPGDKSISHRAIMLGSLAKGETFVTNFLSGEDCLRTIDIFRSFGVMIEQSGSSVRIISDGFNKFKEPKEPLYFGNSGTTARLMLGILAGLPIHTVAYGDPYLTIRPMDRVTEPLRKMGACIDGRDNGNYLPLAIRGKQLQSIHYELPVKSAQVKSAILLAGLFADRTTTIIERVPTRNHTENMLQAFGANLTVEKEMITVNSIRELKPVDILVPGDISSAAFWIVAAAIVPQSVITMKNIGLNETRDGIIDVLKQMGSSITITNERTIGGEKVGDVTVTHHELRSVTIEKDMIPRLIDELPIIALLATQANGTTVIKNAEELRVKETDRIAAVVDVLKTLGATIEETDDGMIITGPTTLTGGEIKSYGDHRIAMMGAIASFITKEDVTIDDVQVIDVSYPTFLDEVKRVLEG
ncbi:MAG TPA: 3-phosphoshikimate 1-carboxyvinyltransferase [Pseudogracilibacillus sp.]|nr:3-phosphoshikimate 1-carboxyvinyltransferase [Pseudogracilibacillus sp.]